VANLIRKREATTRPNGQQTTRNTALQHEHSRQNRHLLRPSYRLDSYGRFNDFRILDRFFGQPPADFNDFPPCEDHQITRYVVLTAINGPDFPPHGLKALSRQGNEMSEIRKRLSRQGKESGLQFRLSATV
jgi:hypothetical protein